MRHSSTRRDDYYVRLRRTRRRRRVRTFKRATITDVYPHATARRVRRRVRLRDRGDDGREHPRSTGTVIVGGAKVVAKFVV